MPHHPHLLHVGVSHTVRATLSGSWAVVILLLRAFDDGSTAVVPVAQQPARRGGHWSRSAVGWHWGAPFWRAPHLRAGAPPLQLIIIIFTILNR